MQEPTFPEIERKSGNEGRAILHVVVDGKRNVRIPTADSSPGPAFANAAIEAREDMDVRTRKAQWGAVAVLIAIEMKSDFTWPSHHVGGGFDPPELWILLVLSYVPGRAAIMV